ncbi:translation initiation factor 4G [Chloropicon primus]|nr:translation initiation factor 4G [Chloropicon primus]
MARGRGGEREGGASRGGGGRGGNKWGHGHSSQDGVGGGIGGGERGRGRGRANRGGRGWGPNPNASHAHGHGQQQSAGVGGDGGLPAAGSGSGAQGNQKPSMLQALTSGPPGLKPAAHSGSQQANGNLPNQAGGRKGQDGKSSGGKGGVPLQFGTITPNFLGMAGQQQQQQQQQPPAHARDAKAAGGKDGAQGAAGKDGSSGQPKGPANPAQAQKQMGVSPNPGQGQQQVPSIVKPPHHHGGYPPSMNAAFMAAAQASARQVEAGGVQGGFPAGVNLPPQFRSPQGMHAYHLQHVAAQQAAQQVPGQQQMQMSPMNMNQMQQMMSQMQLDQRSLPPQVQLQAAAQAAQAAQMPRQAGMGQIPGGMPRMPPQMAQSMGPMGPGGAQAQGGGSAALAAILADRARRKTKAIAIIDPETKSEVQIVSPDKAKKKEGAAQGATESKPDAPKEGAESKETVVPIEKAEKKAIEIKDVAGSQPKTEEAPQARKPIAIEDPKKPGVAPKAAEVSQPVAAEKPAPKAAKPEAAPAPQEKPEAAPVAPAEEPSIPEEGADGPPYKYSKEFLLSFRSKFTKEPEGLEKSEATIHGSSGGPSFGHGFKHHGGPPGSPMHGHHRRQGSEGGDEWSRKRGGKHHGGGMSGLQGLMPGSRGKRGGAPGMRHGGRHGGGHHGNFNRGGNWDMYNGPKVELHKTDNKFVVGQLQSEDPEEEKKQKEIKSVLNKLTPQNFDKLVLKLIDMKFDQEKSLVGFIDQIFDKSLTEPTFCELYAQLCQSLRDQLPEFESDGKKVTFRRVLLNKCQEEFEMGDLSIKETRERIEAAESMKFDPNAVETESSKPAEEKKEESPSKDGEKLEEGEIPKTPEAEKPTDPMKTAKTEKEFDLAKQRKIREIRDDELKARRRMLGNVIFIGQLYKHQMLTEKIMHKCIVEQLKNIENPEPESVECLCKLLTTIGGQIDQPKSKKMIDEYFRRLEQLSKNPVLDSRIRFMVQDVIDLRYNSWRLRRKVEGPKLLSEVHKDAMAAMAPKGGRGGGRRGDRGQDYGRGGNYGRGSPKDHNLLHDDGFLEYSKRPQSGLSGRPNAMPTRLAPANFLKTPNFKNKGDGRPSSSPSRVGGKGMLGKGMRDHGDQKFGGRGGETVQVSKPVVAEKPSPSKSAMSEEETSKKAKGIIEEFHNLNDYKEVGECIKEIKEKNANLGLVLKFWLSDLLEGKKRSVEHFRKLMLELGTSGLFKKEDFHFGLLQTICTLEDLEIDVPKAPGIVAEVFGDLIANKFASMEILGKPLLKAFEDFTGDKVEDLFGETEVYQDFALLLHKSLIERESKAWQLKAVEAEFAKAGVTLKPFEAEKIEKHQCQNIFAHITYKRHVTQALANGADPAYLANWFDLHFDKKGVKANSKLASSTLADVLLRALGDSSDASPSKLSDSIDLDKELSMIVDSNHGIHKLFNKLVDKGNVNAEFECVLALQLVNHKLGAPKGLMTRLLQDFYDADVLSEESFTKWRDDNKDETPGKVKAISDSTAWLNWLAEQSDPEDSDEKE